MTSLTQDEWDKYYRAKSKKLAVCILIYVMAASRFPLLARVADLARYFILIGFFFRGNSRRCGSRADYIPAIMFLIATIPSLFGSDFFLESSIKCASVFLLFVAAAAYFSKYSGSATRLVFDALLVVSGVSLLLNTITLVTGTGMFYGMFIGYFANRNSNGPMLVISLMVLFGAYQKNNRKTIISALIVLNVFMIVLTGSRGAFLGMCIGSAAFIFLSLEKKILAPLAAGAIAAVIAALWGPISKLGPVQRILIEGIQRDDLWPFALEKLREKPYFGTGFGVNALVNTESLSAGMNYHNSYLDILVSVGYFGSAIIALLFLRSALKIAKKYIYSKFNDRRIEYSALLSICVAFLGLSFGEGYLLAAGSPFCFIFWCCVFALQYT